ncbi:hypothetical protein [Tenacibaculum caenipelagi]|uniref:Uncharacterized protein n=1 Tax=Tenacibaculum caenipelagi TaxID=1325435 RepID=A0A4V3D330_9FLAO|nr:hypothetical protein [Tenacibaculum caenipelagi]TDQ27574.1 hypothetical protein DFQ07_1425 [Tenacibaculum caenipelagi]
MKKLELYWQDINIGTLTETNWDIRSSGNIQFKFKYQEKTTENSHLAEFINHSIKTNDYLENDDQNKYNMMCEEEIKFLDLIDSSEWKLINSKSEEIKILCPIFHNNNEITWQRE